MWGIPDYNHEAYKYQPKWEKLVDYSPERNPSGSLRGIKALPGGPIDCFLPDGTTMQAATRSRVIAWYHVRGVGIIILETSKTPSDDGKLVYTGMSIISKEDLGYSEKMGVANP